MTPWTDRSGRISPLKLASFVATLLPGIALAAALWLGTLGPKPVTAAIHETGDWAVRFLLLSLAVTPLRRIADWPRLILVRRMLGLAALGYAAIHLALYVVDQKLNLAAVASEIVLRVYLTIGFVALAGLTALGATSTDAAIRRMGGTWQRLHRIVYPIAVLAILHFFLQSKLDVSEPTLMAGLFVLLMAYRGMQAAGIDPTPASLAAAAAVSALATAGIEAGWYAATTGVDPVRLIEANLDFSYTVRPAWWVGATGLAVSLVAALRRRNAGSRRGRTPRRPVREAA